MVLAQGLAVMADDEMRARARHLANGLADRTEPAVVEAREFLSQVGEGLALEGHGQRARDLALALEYR